MYIATVPNRSSPPAILLRQSFRQQGKVNSRTLANLSSWPQARIDALRRLLRGELDTSTSADPTLVLAGGGSRESKVSVRLLKRSGGRGE